MNLNEFYRIKRLPPYVFAEINASKAKYRAEGRDIIDLGMGNPDSPSPAHVVEKLKETVDNPKTHGYSMSRGILGLRKAQAAYYQRRFNVELDPEKEVITTIGSKEGLANLVQAITAPGDVVMVPNPSYPIHPYGAIIVGASVWHLPKGSGKDFIAQLKRAIKHCQPKPIALIFSYPCNPTTETASLEFYQEIIDICKFHNIYVISDLAYCEIYFDNNPPPSILEVKGAMDIAIEFTSMSKTYSMAGWRIGFGVGNQTLVAALRHVKSYLDYGAFTPIQVAAATAINSPESAKYITNIRTLYKERRDIVIKGLSDAGWGEITPPTASMFIWAKIPEKYQHLGSMKFSKMLLDKAEVAVAPGIGFGEYGDEYVRIALVENKQRLRQAIRNIKHFISE